MVETAKPRSWARSRRSGAKPARRMLASSLRVVVAGSLPERVGRGVCNTMYVINATGVVIHTNQGRSLLAEDAAAARDKIAKAEQES